MKKVNYLNIVGGLLFGYLLAIVTNKLRFSLAWEDVFTHAKTWQFLALYIVVWGVIRVSRNRKKIKP